MNSLILDLDVNAMMKLKKMELIRIINNLSRERDELFHQKESLKEELDEVETYEDEFYQLEEIKDILERIKTEKERASWGVSLARETEVELTEKLFDYI